MIVLREGPVVGLFLFRSLSYRLVSGVVWSGLMWCGVVWCGVVWVGYVTMFPVFDNTFQF